ncbi:hypothetical protein [Actinophytocola sp.]|uniref:hypothetical protein n=1 Tax=Actinophytocola sp. TaxID=1872138 RepID=UPI003D6AFBBA
MLEVPSATPTGRPIVASTEAAPRTIVSGSRTGTGTDPAVIAIRAVLAPTAAASANASQVGPSPSQTSPYPNRSAVAATSAPRSVAARSPAPRRPR